MTKQSNEFLRLIIFGITATAPAAWGVDFFPLREGNSWTYRNPATGQAFTVRVGSAYYLNERIYYSVRGYTDQPLLVGGSESSGIGSVELVQRAVLRSGRALADDFGGLVPHRENSTVGIFFGQQL